MTKWHPFHDWIMSFVSKHHCQTSLCVAPSIETLSWTSFNINADIYSMFAYCETLASKFHWYIPISMFAYCQTPQCQCEGLFVSRHTVTTSILTSTTLLQSQMPLCVWPSANRHFSLTSVSLSTSIRCQTAVSWANKQKMLQHPWLKFLIFQHLWPTW